MWFVPDVTHLNLHELRPDDHLLNPGGAPLVTSADNAVPASIAIRGAPVNADTIAAAAVPKKSPNANTHLTVASSTNIKTTLKLAMLPLLDLPSGP